MDLNIDDSSVNDTDAADVWNSSVYIVRPEKDGSFYSHCAAITLKSDLAVTFLMDGSGSGSVGRAVASMQEIRGSNPDIGNFIYYLSSVLYLDLY